MKVLHVSLLFMANFWLSTFALPASLNDQQADVKERNAENILSRRGGIGFGTALGHGKSKSNDASEREKAYQKIFGGKREMMKSHSKRGPFTFGTGLGYDSNSGSSSTSTSDYLNDWQKAYDALYSDKNQQKRGPFTFGTALGHNTGGDNGDYANSLNAKYNELFGKRDEMDDDSNIRWEDEQ